MAIKTSTPPASLQSAYDNGATIAQSGGLGVSILDPGTLAAFFEATDGSAAAVSPANTGRLRYNEVANQWEQSSNGAAYAALSGGGGTLQSAYNGGAAIATSTLNGAVAISGSAANNDNVLTVTKNPAGAQSGAGIAVSMGATTTGNGLEVFVATGATGNGMIVGLDPGTTGNGVQVETLVTASGDAYRAVIGGSGRGLNVTMDTTSVGSGALFNMNAGSTGRAVQIFSASTGSNPGIEFSSVGAFTGPGVYIGQSATSTGHGLQVVMDAGATGSGATFTMQGTGTNPGISVTSTGAFGGEGLAVTQSATSIGNGITVTMTAGATGRALTVLLNNTAGVGGIEVNATAAYAGPGISVSMAGATTGAGISGTSSGSGAAIEGVAAGVGFAGDFTGPVRVTGKLTVTGLIDPTAVLLSSGTDLYFQSDDGSTAAVAPVNRGRIRYLNGTGWQVSSSGGAYATLATGTPTLAQVLASGNTTGANDILVTTGQALDAATAAASLKVGTTNAGSLSVGTAASTTSAFQVFVNQGGATLHGSNAGFQFASTTSNRASGRYNQYGANTGVPGIAGFKSRGTNVGDLASVADGDILARMTAIGVAADNASIPLAGFVDIRVPTGGTQATWVATDFAVSLVPLAGPINSNRLVSRITSEAAFELIDGTTAAVSPAAKGNLRYNNTTKTFQVSVDTGAWTSLATTATASYPVAPSGGVYTTSATGPNAFAAGVSASAAGSGSVVVGETASAAAGSGDRGVAIGYGTASGLDSVNIGYLQANASTRSVAIGSLNGAGTGSGDDSVGIGFRVTANGGGSGKTIVIGSTATDSGQTAVFVAGSSSVPMTTVYFGQGISNAFPVAYTISGTGGFGAGVAGAALNLSGGLAGDAATAGGAINLQVALAGTGTTRTTVWTIANTGFLNAGVDNTYDIGGAAGTPPRPRTVYAGTSFVAGNSVTVATSSVTGSGALSVTATAATLALAATGANSITLATAGSTRWSVSSTGVLTAATGINSGGVQIRGPSDAGFQIEAGAGQHFYYGTSDLHDVNIYTDNLSRWRVSSTGSLVGVTSTAFLTWDTGGPATQIVGPTDQPLAIASASTRALNLTATSAALGLIATGANSITMTTNGALGLTLNSSSNVLMVGKTSSYANVNTAGWGVAAIYGSGRSTAQTAAVASVATYTVGAADGSFDVSANVNVTTSTAHSFTVTVAYTDEANAAQTLTLTFSQVAGTLITAITNVTGTGPYSTPGGSRIRCKNGTAITVATTGTFTTVTYNVEATISQVT